jgi:hypothetical protein
MALLFALQAVPAQAADAPVSWVEFAADGNLSVRTVIAPGAACPVVAADGATVSGRPRNPPNDAFAVQVCEARVPVATARLTVGGQPMPVAPKQVNRIAIIGDTGCRLEGKALQDCRDPVAWPLPVIAGRAAARHPDLVIHVGDYYYRESACPTGRAGCVGSPHGDAWPTWNADFFAPVAPLFSAAPWVMIRGNHESCNRGGAGWFRLIDPYPARADCVERTEPYHLSLGGLDLLPFDDADADDFKAPADKVAGYAAQLATILAAAPPHAWLVLHRPVWAQAQAQLSGVTINQTMQAAIRDKVPANLDMVLSGHLHDFLSYDFGPQRPPQLVVGTGGDALLPLGHDKIVGADIAGIPVRAGYATQRFGYFIMERSGTGWDGTLYAPDDSVITSCHIAGRSLACQ